MRLALAVLVTATVARATRAAEQTVERVTIGTLTCSVETTRKLTAPALREISCTFERLGTGTRENYEGEIIHHGPNVTLGAEEVLVWNVWAPKKIADDGALLGKYFGVQVDDPNTPGLGANSLVSGDGQGVLLEPVVNPGTGAGPHKTISVNELELRAARI